MSCCAIRKDVIMRLIAHILTVILLFPSVLFATIYDAENCSVATIQAIHDDAGTIDGDTIRVPACSETEWSSALTVTKGIILQGAGKTSTYIKAVAGVTRGVIKYIPASPSTSHRFRVTGFNINQGGITNGIYLLNATTTYEYIRIDNNTFTRTSDRGIYSAGTFAGVIDNNTFTNNGSGAGAASFYGLDGTSWGLSRDFGKEYNIYFEDNTIIDHADAGIHGSGQGGRYVSRYNTYTSDANMSSVNEFHGNQPGGSCLGETNCGNSSTMVVEYYGNSWDIGDDDVGNAIDQRGGQALIFFNKLLSGGTSAMYAREEYADALWPLGAEYTQKVTNSYQWGNRQNSSLFVTSINEGENCCKAAAEAWQSTHDYGSDITCKKFTGDPNGYCWKSCSAGLCGATTGVSGSTEPTWSTTTIRNYLTDGGMQWLNMGVTNGIALNTDLWVQSATGVFNGTGDASAGGGVGCGTLAARPTTCTTGVGYWATNQDCSNISDYVGANPTTPISGTLYKCTATNIWEPYYTPYTYPHPLRRLGNQLSGGVVAGGTF